MLTDMGLLKYSGLETTATIAGRALSIQHPAKKAHPGDRDGLLI